MFKGLKATAFLIKCYSGFGMQWLESSNKQVKPTEFVGACFLQEHHAAVYLKR